jgi:hypothetical protein
MGEKIRLEKTEIAQRDFESHLNEEQMLVNVVVNQVQNELGVTIKTEPHISPEEIISMARNRFVDLLNKDLLTEREANKCYQRFVQMVSYYYGTP